MSYFDSLSVKTRRYTNYDANVFEQNELSIYQKFHNQTYPNIKMQLSGDRFVESTSDHEVIITYNFNKKNLKNNNVNLFYSKKEDLDSTNVFKERKTNSMLTDEKFKNPKDTLFIILKPHLKDSVYTVHKANLLVDSITLGSWEGYRIFNLEENRKNIVKEMYLGHSEISESIWSKYLESFKLSCHLNDNPTCGTGWRELRYRKFQFASIFVDKANLKHKNTLYYSGKAEEFLSATSNMVDYNTENPGITVKFLAIDDGSQILHFKEVFPAYSFSDYYFPIFKMQFLTNPW